MAQLETDAADARRRAEADRKLHARPMLSDIDIGLSTDRANDLSERLKLGQEPGPGASSGAWPTAPAP